MGIYGGRRGILGDWFIVGFEESLGLFGVVQGGPWASVEDSGLKGQGRGARPTIPLITGSGKDGDEGKYEASGVEVRQKERLPIGVVC